MTIYDATLAEVLARLQGSPALISNSNVRRAHPTDVTLDNSPAVRVIDGADKCTEGNCIDEHDAEFTVRIIFRGDSESTSADAWNVAQEVMTRLNPNTSAYTNSPQISPPTITPDREVADQDLYALDMAFRMKYTTAPWSLA